MKSYIYPQTIQERASMVREAQTIEFHQSKYVYYPQGLNPAIPERMGDELQQALQQRQIQVFLQPRMHLPEERLCAAEALARWQWPDGSWSLPDQFLPALEQTGLIPQLDFYMLEEVAKLQQQWSQQRKLWLPVSVNLSVVTLLQPDVVERITALAVQYQLNAGQLELEVTERNLAEQQMVLLPVVQQLRQAGFPVHLDDFGTGSSSLSTLLQLPVDFVKLDRSFLEQDLHNQRTDRYIRQLVQLLQAAEVKIIFEGVETEAQALFLRSLPVEQGQGWYWQRPLHWRVFEQNYLYMAQ